MALSGDHWPIFLYHNYNYDPEDPWNGLLQNILLVKVDLAILFIILFLYTDHFFRFISIYSHLLALSIKKPRPHDLVMHASMV